MLDIYSATDIGCVRQHNEDWVHHQLLEANGRGLAVLADGMGGYAGGALASRLAGEQFTKSVLTALHRNPISNDEYAALLLQAGADANQSVRMMRAENRQHEKMGTTLVAMLILDLEFWVLHVGDSRCYRHNRQQRDADLQQITMDHSLVQELVDKGSMTAEEAVNAPFRNMLTRAIGPEDDLRYSLAKHRIRPGDVWLLCSDGLYNALPDEQISDWLGSDLTADSIAKGLVDGSLENHATDNVSVVVIKQQ